MKVSGHRQGNVVGSLTDITPQGRGAASALGQEAA